MMRRVAANNGSAPSNSKSLIRSIRTSATGESSGALPCKSGLAAGNVTSRLFQLGLEFFFACSERVPQRFDIRFRFSGLRKHLSLLFLHMMLHVLGQHHDLGIVHILVRSSPFELRDETLDTLM